MVARVICRDLWRAWLTFSHSAILFWVSGSIGLLFGCLSWALCRIQIAWLVDLSLGCRRLIQVGKERISRFLRGSCSVYVAWVVLFKLIKFLVFYQALSQIFRVFRLIRCGFTKGSWEISMLANYRSQRRNLLVTEQCWFKAQLHFNCRKICRLPAHYSKPQATP